MNRKQRRADQKAQARPAPVGAMSQRAPAGAMSQPAPAAPQGLSADLQELFAAALAHHQAGRLAEASPLYQQVLAAAPRHADSLHLQGVVALQSGRAELAVDLIGQAIAVNGMVASFHSNLGNAVRDLGRRDDAIACYRRALTLRPDYPEGHNNLGNALKEQGAIAESVACYRRALASRPDYPEAHNNLGTALKELGLAAEAIDHFRHAMAQRPAFAEALANLANALKEAAQLEDAVQCYRRAIALRPDLAELHNNLGNTLQDLGRLDDAAQSYRHAMALRPLIPEIHNNLANCLQAQGRLEEALPSYRRALALRPDYPEAHHNLANSLKELGRLPEAIAGYRQALALRPNFAEAHYFLGNALKDQGQYEAALACFHQALALRPDYAEARWAVAMSQIPAIPETDAASESARANFAQELAALDDWFGPDRLKAGHQAVGSQQPFYLAYQDHDNKALLARYGQLCHRLMAPWQQAHGYAPSPKAETGRISVGIVSNHVFNHSVWTALVKGWMLHLDRSRFDVHVFYLGKKHDAETALARQLALSFTEGKQSVAQWAEAILARHIQILIYPEIGMDVMTAKLASLRLAPVQMASWGHPETTGLPTMDYYLSAEDLEAEGAQDRYTETLIKLPHLGCCWQSTAITPQAPDLRQWGIDPDQPLLLCPGTPYKYAPHQDWVLVDIARRLGRCQLVFFTHRDLSGLLRDRLERVFHQAGLNFADFGVFVPWLDQTLFHGLMRQAHVYLDTIGFSGFNTAMQAVECGLPIVTCAGHSLRGRLASAILTRIGLADCVAANEEEYVSLAVKLAGDGESRKRIRQRLQVGLPMLVDDRAPVRALEEFMVTAAGRGGD